MLALIICIMVAHCIFLGLGDDIKPRWVDFQGGPEEENNDPAFDRVVIIKFEAPKEPIYLTTGVLVSTNRIVTSVNPFRKMLNSLEDLKRIKILVLLAREWNGNRPEYEIGEYDVICGRPVIPFEPVLWHGVKSTLHSPVHDIMILRTFYNMWIPGYDHIYKLSKWYKSLNPDTKGNRTGPLLTRMAHPGLQVPQNFKIASLAFIDNQHIKDSWYLRSVEFQEREKMIEDCDEWIPREWGYFICVRNTKHFKGIGSGAILLDTGKLIFGIGSFYLKKGQKSILVFTDIRPYSKYVKMACGNPEYFNLSSAARQYMDDWGIDKY